MECGGLTPLRYLWSAGGTLWVPTPLRYPMECGGYPLDFVYGSDSLTEFR
jgi:hypothetical protein